MVTCSKCNPSHLFKIFIIIGIIFTATGSLLVAYWQKLFEHIMNKEIQIKPGSTSYPIWKDVDLPLQMEFYFLDWENPTEILNHSIKPRIIERGPYVFSEKRVKLIHAWNDENSTVTFRQNRTWYFVPSLSNGTLDDTITTLDGVAVAAAYALRHSEPWLKLALEFAMRIFQTKHYVTKTVRELSFDGYSDPLLNLANLAPPGLIPLEIPFKKFAWMSERNGTADYDGIFNMFTGVKDIRKVGAIGQWNYSNRTGYYEFPCDMTNGSAGEIFPTKPEKTTISVFAPDLCRSFKLVFKEMVELQGIKALRFWADKKLLGNSSTEPANRCFCSSDAEKCPADGVVNVTACKWGAPAFVSLPHFFHGDPIYENTLAGMEPNEDKHQLFIDLEEMTGFPLQVNVSLQINLLLQPIENYTIFRGMPEIVFPMLWFRQYFAVDNELRGQLKLILLFSKIGSIFSIVLTVVGILMLAFSVLFWCMYSGKEIANKKLLFLK